MATNTLEIVIKANAGQAQATLKSLDKTIGKFGTSSGKGFDALKAKWAALDAKMSSPAGMKAMIGTAGMVVGALAGVGMAVKKLADDYMDYAFQVKDFGRIIGATPEEASKLIQVADDVRLSVESMTTAMRSAITKGYAPTIAELGRMSDQYLAIQDPIERSRFLVETFGRSGLEMAKLLELGSAKIKEMGDSVEGTARLMTTQGIKAAEEYYQAMDKLGEAGEDLSLTLGTKATPVITDLANLMSDLAGGISNSAIPALLEFNNLVQMGAIEADEARKMVWGYFTGLYNLSDLSKVITERQAAFARSLGTVRIGTTDLIQPTKEVTDETEDLAGTTDKAAASMDKFAGAIRRVPKSINIGFDFKMPDITSELENLVKGDKWRSAGGAAIEEFWSGVRGGVEGLSGDALQAAASKIGALELAAKVEIGEISKQEAISQLKAAFGGTGGEAAATINAALAIDPNSVEEIKSYLQTVLTEPTNFTVTPTADPASIEELKAAMAGPFDAVANISASDTSRTDLINQIKGFVSGDIPVELTVRLKEMNKAELAAVAKQLAPKPIEITVTPAVDQTALEFLYNTTLAGEANPVMVPKVDIMGLENARALMENPVYVPLIGVWSGSTGGGGGYQQPQRLGRTATGRMELETGIDKNGNGIIGAKYGLDMTIPPGFPNDSFRVAVTSGERVQVTRPGEKGGNTVNNFYITGGANWNVRELARQVTREQQRAGVK